MTWTSTRSRLWVDIGEERVFLDCGVDCPRFGRMNMGNDFWVYWAAVTPGGIRNLRQRSFGTATAAINFADELASETHANRNILAIDTRTDRV